MPADRAVSMLLLLVGLLLRPASGLSQSYCSHQNSASDKTPAYWQYQSNGWCHDHCSDAGPFAFAIVQDFYCWCSDLVPSDQEDVDNCSDTCPGFGSDNCGNKGEGLFGYIALSEKPSGTFSGPAASQSHSAQPGSSTSSTDVRSRTMTETSVQTAGQSTTVSSVTTSTPSVTTPIVTVQIITESGAPITKTVTIMPTDPSQMEQTSKKSSSSGVIAGAVVGAIVGLAAVIGVLVWCLWFQRRKLQNEKDSEKANGAATKVPPQRHPSTLSKAGLLRTERDFPPTLAIPGPTRHSSNGTDGISPISGGGSSSDRRNSRPLFYDQRLNPSALMDLDNGSHTSIATMEDNKDYTRTLNVRNPDPPDA